MQRWLAGLIVGAVGTLAVLGTIDDPGLTIDEPINVGHGKHMIWLLEHPSPDASTGINWLWSTAHEHPPLSRFLVGLSHAFFDPSPRVADSFSPLFGRPASAFAYGIVLMLVTVWGWRLAGNIGGWGSGLAVLSLPRLFGQAHFASPEVISTAALLAGLTASAAALDGMSQSQPWRNTFRIGWAGFWIGIALLTKLTSVLLPLTLCIVFLEKWRLRGFVALVGMGVVSFVVFVAGWPWLWPVNIPGYSAGWLGSAERLFEFFRVGVDRATIYVDYFGKQYPNANGGVPWHFVWVFFLTTVPVGIHLLAIPGSIRLWRLGATIPSARLLLAQIVVILLFFTLPIERYDGDRLFLPVFPLWGIAAGIGAAVVAQWLGSRHIARPVATGSVTLFLLLQFIGIARMHPYELSYYNALVGGLRGANRLGLEATYWGDSVNEPILSALARDASRGDVVVLAPALYVGHATYMTSPELRAKNIAIVPASDEAMAYAKWGIVFHRDGYLIDPMPQEIMKRGTLVDEVSRDGVWLTRLYRLTPIPAEKSEPASDVH